MFEHINDILCSHIFLISMEIIFKSENLHCSVRDLVIKESCRAGNLLSNDIKYVMIG